jgi:uncharacterized protein YggE
MRAPLALVALLAGILPAFAQPAPPTVTVSGEAQVSVAPDMAQIDGGVTTEARFAREASESNNKIMAAILPALKAAGIAESDVRTSRVSLYPQSSPSKVNGPSQIVGYRASNRVTVRIRDVTKVATTIDALVGAGANDIGGVNFIVSQESKLLDDARVKAIEDARRKAEIYAKAANIRLGAPVSISEEGGGDSPRPVLRAQFKAGAMATPIAPGEETLRVSVSVAYEIVK